MVATSPGFLRERPDFQPEFLRPGKTLVGTSIVPMFGSDVPLVEINFLSRS
jgi:hypothetical protein